VQKYSFYHPFGVPVVVSNVGSLPEVVGEAGIYIKPDDIESIRHGIEKVLNLDTSEYNKLVTRGLDQVKKFSWDKCSKLTLEVLENVTRQKRK